MQNAKKSRHDISKIAVSIEPMISNINMSMPLLNFSQGLTLKRALLKSSIKNPPLNKEECLKFHNRLISQKNKLPFLIDYFQKQLEKGNKYSVSAFLSLLQFDETDIIQKRLCTMVSGLATLTLAEINLAKGEVNKALSFYMDVLKKGDDPEKALAAMRIKENIPRLEVIGSDVDITDFIYNIFHRSTNDEFVQEKESANFKMLRYIENYEANKNNDERDRLLNEIHNLAWEGGEEDRAAAINAMYYLMNMELLQDAINVLNA